MAPYIVIGGILTWGPSMEHESKKKKFSRSTLRESAMLVVVVYFVQVL